MSAKLLHMGSRSSYCDNIGASSVRGAATTVDTGKAEAEFCVRDGREGD